jgi:hypothetical protein
VFLLSAIDVPFLQDSACVVSPFFYKYLLSSSHSYLRSP